MVKNPSIRFSESLARFSQILTQEEIQQLLDLQAADPPIGLRINSLKGEPIETIKALASRYNWDIFPVSFCENAWEIKTAGDSPGRTIEHRLGQYYLQDPASMIPVSLMDFDDDQPIILDMAASPGGKTTHLIDRTADRGFVLANDASRGRIPALRSVLTTWGGVNTAITNFPGEQFGNWFPEVFDQVLLDAPCSMENLRPSQNKPLRETTSTERSRLQERQFQLLISGLKALKVGGQLVYATCSLAPEEDEAVIDQAIQAYSDAFNVDDVSLKLPFHVPGLTAFAKDQFHPNVINSLRLWPHLTGMSGFFCARLTKTNQISSSQSLPPSREFSRTGFEPVSSSLKNKIIEHLIQIYGFDLTQLIHSQHLQIWMRYEKIYLIPEVHLNHFSCLPFEYLGMLLGQFLNNSLRPSSEFISRFGHTFSKGKLKLNPFQAHQWVDGHDIRNPHTGLKAKGQYLLIVDDTGRNLGLGKLLEKRLRNLLPRGLI